MGNSECGINRAPTSEHEIPNNLSGQKPDVSKDSEGWILEFISDSPFPIPNSAFKSVFPYDKPDQIFLS
jgi:hypothetical protein